jgi:hypothetical protein
LEFQVTQEWLKKVAPALKICVFILKTALAIGALTTKLPLTVLSDFADNIALQVDSFDNFVSKYLDPDTLNELTQSERSHMDMDSLGDDRIIKFIGEAYKVLEQKANKDKCCGWKAAMKPELNDSGVTIWVKNEFENLY